jgi:hypothetical protein
MQKHETEEIVKKKRYFAPVLNRLVRTPSARNGPVPEFIANSDFRIKVITDVYSQKKAPLKSSSFRTLQSCVKVDIGFPYNSSPFKSISGLQPPVSYP